MQFAVYTTTIIFITKNVIFVRSLTRQFFGRATYKTKNNILYFPISVSAGASKILEKAFKETGGFY